MTTRNVPFPERLVVWECVAEVWLRERATWRAVGKGVFFAAVVAVVYIDVCGVMLLWGK